MTILYATGLKPYKHPEPYDINEKKYYSLSYRPKTWTTATEYKKGVDLVIPTTPNGMMYECQSGGISGGTEPTFSTTEGETTTDGSVTWVTRAYDLLLNTGDSVTASIFKFSSDPAWEATTAYAVGDTVVPLIANGFVYDVTNAGTTGGSEPTWPTTEDDTVTDGTVIFTARANGGTVDNQSIVGGIQTKFRLTSVPSGSTSVTLVNHITVTRANSDVEEFDRSIVIKVRTL